MSFFRKIIQQLIPEEALPTEERRESVRLNFQTEIVIEVDNKSIPASLVNLTFTGVCIKSKKRLAEDQVLTLERDEVGPPFAGIVLWSKPTNDGQYLTGIQCELDEEQLLQSWLYQTLIEAGFVADYVDEKRNLIRVPGRVACSLRTISDKDLGQGQMLDLSIGGALLEWDEEVSMVTAVSFETKPVGGLKPLTGKGSISSSEQKDDGKWLCGLQFTKTDQELVKKYMKAMLTSS